MQTFYEPKGAAREDDKPIVITLPPKRFMNVEMCDGQAEITFSDHCELGYNLEIKDGGQWSLPTE